MSEQETWLLAAVALLTPPIGLVVFNVLFLRVCMVEETVGESLENYLDALTKVQKERAIYDKRLLDFRRSRLGLSKAMMAEAANGAEEGSMAARAAATETTDADEASAAQEEHAKAERLDMLRSMGISVPEDDAEAANGGASAANGGAVVPNGGPAASNGAVAVPAGLASAANGGAVVPNGGPAASNGAVAVPAGLASAANGGAVVPNGGPAASNGAVAVPPGIASVANGEPPSAPAPDRVADGSGKISLLKALAAEPTSWPGGGGLDAEPPGPVDSKSEAELGGAIRRMMSGGEPEDS